MQILIFLVFFIFISAWAVMLTSVINFYIIPTFFPDTNITIHYIFVLLFILFCYYMYIKFSSKESEKFSKFRKKFYK